MKKIKSRVAILTLPLTNNYGGILQAYALKEVLQSYNYDTLLIDYRRKSPAKKNILNMSIRNLIKKTLLKYKKLKLAETPAIEKEISIKAKKFIDTELGNKTEPLYSFSELKRLNDTVDAFVVGSDQVWRPDYTPDIKRYFFDFVDTGKTVFSYAASFGTDDWKFNSEDQELCNKYIKRFRGVSVRESSAVNIVEEKFSVKADLVLDPTLLLSKCDYIELINKYNEPKSKGNLFCYILDKNVFSENVVSKISKKLGIMPFEVKPKKADYNYSRHDEEYIYPFMTTWIRAFYDADYVVVDSFHGCVFSIIFNKPFIAIGNVERGLARFESLLSLFGLNERLILSNEHFIESKIDYHYDWENINSKISFLQEKSKQFILKTIENY